MTCHRKTVNEAAPSERDLRFARSRGAEPQSLGGTRTSRHQPASIDLQRQRAERLLQFLRARNRGLTGRLAEAYARPRNAGSKTRIPSLTSSAAYRIPDVLTAEELVEIKNVKRQGLSRQIQDFLLYAEQTGRTFAIFVREETILSGPLTSAAAEGRIAVRRLGPLLTPKGEAILKQALMPLIWQAMADSSQQPAAILTVPPD